jgi:hypothetical protein
LGAKINYLDFIFNVTRMQQLIFRTLALHFLASFAGENFEVKAGLDEDNGASINEIRPYDSLEDSFS